MSKRDVQLILLCEDTAHRTFLLKFFKKKGWQNNQIHSVPFPHGKGCGEKHVREQFPIELKAIRSRSVNTALVAIIDEDNQGTQKRIKQMEDSCREKSIAYCQENEPVIVLIPKRNIETWFRYLEGQSADEKTNYSLPKYKLKARGVAKTAAIKLAMRCELGTIGDNPPPSLLVACEAYKQRIIPVVKAR